MSLSVFCGTSKMYLCNLELGLSGNGNIHINFTDCNEADARSRDTGNMTRSKMTSRSREDSFGAMQYTIAVVALYGIAMLGVFAMGQFRRRKQRHDKMDHETNVFLKNYDEVRRTWEQQSRVGVVSALLHQLHNQPVSNEYCNNTRPSVNSLAFLPITLSGMQSNVDTVSEEDVTSLLSFDTRAYDRVLSTDDNEELVSEERNVSKEARVTLLGSSRRTFSRCDQCLTSHGVSVHRYECQCISAGPAQMKDYYFETNIDEKVHAVRDDKL